MFLSVGNVARGLVILMARLVRVIVTLDHAYLWTDGRYFLQAEQQLDSKHYTMMKQSGFAPETEQWIQENARGKRLGIDPRFSWRW